MTPDLFGVTEELPSHSSPTVNSAGSGGGHLPAAIFRPVTTASRTAPP